MAAKMASAPTRALYQKLSSQGIIYSSASCIWLQADVAYACRERQRQEEQERVERLAREEAEEEKRYEAYCQAQLRQGKRVQVGAAACWLCLCMHRGP